MTTEAAALDGCPDVLSNQDLLQEIFLRLPWSTCVGAAALVCKSWRRVICDAKFLRRCRSLHPPALGYYHSSWLSRLPVFTPTLTSSSGTTATADDVDRGAPFPGCKGDFALETVPFDAWSIGDAFDGLILIYRSDVRDALRLAVFCPLAPDGPFLLPPPVGGAESGGEESVYLSSVFDQESYKFDVALLPSERGEGGCWASAFRVVLLVVRLADLKIGAWIYSRAVGEWGFVSFAVLPVEPSFLGTTVSPLMDGIYYWVNRGEYILSVDVGEKQLSVIELPAAIKQRYRNNVEIARTSKGGVAVIGVTGLHLHLWAHRRQAPADQQWELQEDADGSAVVVAELGYDRSGTGALEMELQVCGIGERDGVVFVWCPAVPEEIFALCLQTMRLEKVVQLSTVRQRSPFSVYPYTMPWPRFHRVPVDGPR